MSKIIKQIEQGKFTKKWVAGQLYPDLEIHSAMAKFGNKFNKVKGRKFTEAEIKEIENICK
jgi:ketol-acid reductoisomerase